MSAPKFVNTTDGMCWTRREATRDGQELYALEAVGDCPAHLMETYAELAELGIVDSADVLPMPVGPVPQPLPAERLAEIAARVQAATAGPWWTDTLAESDGSESIGVDAGDDNWIVPCQDLDPADAEFIAHARADVPDLLVDNARLRAQVAALLAERRSTNEALDDTVQELRARQASCSCPSADQPGPHQLGCPLDGVPGSAPDERPVNELTAAFAPVAALREVLDGEHFATVHHDYTGPGRDLPELGGGGRD